MILVYVTVPIYGHMTLLRIREAVARPWLEAYQGAFESQPHVRYWVPSVEDAEDERAVLALAGIHGATIEQIDPTETEK